MLRDPARRAEYDRSLRPRRPPPRYVWVDDPGWDPDVDLDPTPYYRPVTPVADAGVHAMRHLPWLLLVGFLALIFVFTAYAGGGSDSDAIDEGDLLGRCVRITSADGMEETPCSGPNDGEVVLIDYERSGCPPDTFGHTLEAGGNVLCVRA